MSTPEPNAILTAEEVAAWLKIRPRAVQRLGIPAVKMGHRTVRYKASTVLKWIATNEKETA